MNDTLDDWLKNGLDELDGLAPSTVTGYRYTIAKALREELGTVNQGPRHSRQDCPCPCFMLVL